MRGQRPIAARIRPAGVCLSVTLLAIGLLPDAVTLATGNGTKTYAGLPCLLLGVFSGEPSWWANPFLAASWVFLLSWRPRAAAVSSVVAGLLAASFLLPSGRRLLIDATGAKGPVVAVGAGFWCWLASCLVPAAAALGTLWFPAGSRTQAGR